MKQPQCTHRTHQGLSTGTKYTARAAGFWEISPQQTNKQTRGVSHCGLAIHIKNYLNAKDELWKLKYFIMQNYNLQKNPLKETKILQDITTL